MYRALVIATLMVAVAGCRGAGPAGKPLTLIANATPAYVIVCDTSSKPDSFAARELNDIVKGTTGVEFPVLDVTAPAAAPPAKRILIGRNAVVRDLLGDKLLDGLRDQESLVTGRGDDLILVGGDAWGTLYAVYDFVENEAGYRCYAAYAGGDKYVPTDTLVYSGAETRRRPAFDGFRLCYTSPMMIRANISGFSRFLLRNRGTRLDWEKYGEGKSYANDVGLVEKFKLHVPGHGLFYYVSPDDRTWAFWRQDGLPGSFAEHPEYFTLDQHGERVKNIQLCMSNPGLRKLLTERIFEAVEAKGPGVYMVGSNDHSGARYCWCPDCVALEEKYNSVGGPLWDYMLELCPKIEARYPGVYITTLAYKGPRQTEKAPDGVRFPSRFICDAAFLKSCHTLTETADIVMDDGTVFNRYANLKKWVGIADHVSYWYYGGGAPYQVYERHQKEIREMRDAGVRSVGSCGLGSMEFGDLTTYIWLRLLVDPDLDANAVVTDYLAWKYGAAAPIMRGIIEELEQLRRDNIPIRTNWLWADDSYERMIFLTPEQMVRWQGDFDRMAELVADDPVRARNVRIARTAADCWTVVFMPKIRAAYPDLALDAQAIVARGRAAAEEAVKADMLDRNRGAAFKVLDDMSLYAELADTSLPPELAAYPPAKVTRYLPVKPEPWNVQRATLTRDPDAVAGWTMREVIAKPESPLKGVKIEYYDAMEKKWLYNDHLPMADLKPGGYHLYRLFQAPLPRRNRLVFGFMWGSSLDIQKLGRYYDPTYHRREYEVWASLKCTGPLFDPESEDQESAIACDQVFLVNMGTPE